MNIAIVDASLHLLSFARMPGAKLTSIDIAINKAFTAAGHRSPTHVYREAVWPGGAAYGIDKSNGGRFTVIGGGVPIALEGGEVVGAVSRVSVLSAREIGTDFCASGFRSDVARARRIRIGRLRRRGLMR